VDGVANYIGRGVLTLGSPEHEGIIAFIGWFSDGLVTTVQTRVREISNKERFDIVAKGKTGRPLNFAKTGS
jgi:hypothetical protein